MRIALTRPGAIRLSVAVAAVIAVPMAVLGQPPAPAPQSKQPWNERRYCVAYNHIGSRLRTASRCYSKAQYDAMKHDARLSLEYLQILRTHGR